MKTILYVTACPKQSSTCGKIRITSQTSLFSLISNLSESVADSVVVVDEWVPSYAQPLMEFPKNGRSTFHNNGPGNVTSDVVQRASYETANVVIRHSAAEVGALLDSLRDNAINVKQSPLYTILCFLLENNIIQTNDVELSGIIRNTQKNDTSVSLMTIEADESRLEETKALLYKISNEPCSVKKQGPFSYLIDSGGNIIPGTCSISLCVRDGEKNKRSSDAFFESRAAKTDTCIVKPWHIDEKIHVCNHSHIPNSKKKIFHPMKNNSDDNTEYVTDSKSSRKAQKEDSTVTNSTIIACHNNNRNVIMYKSCCSNIPYVICICLASESTETYEHIRKLTLDTSLDENIIKRHWLHGILRSIFTAAKKVGTGRAYVTLFPGIPAKKAIHAVRKYTESARNIREVVLVSFDVDTYAQFLSVITGSKSNSSFLHVCDDSNGAISDLGPRKTIFGKPIMKELEFQAKLIYETCFLITHST